jgi:hypothetical protein
VRSRTAFGPSKEYRRAWRERFVGRLNPQQLKYLSDELAILTKQQSDARMAEVFVRMSQAEIKAFDLRTERISKIHVILSEHDAKR